MPLLGFPVEVPRFGIVTVALAAAVVLPFGQNPSQDVPRAPARSADLNTWVQAPSLALTTPVQTYIFRDLLIAPVPAKRNASLDTWTQAPSLALTSAPPAAPFVNPDFSVPRPGPRSADIGTWTQGPLPVAPFVTLFQS